MPSRPSKPRKNRNSLTKVLAPGIPGEYERSVIITYLKADCIRLKADVVELEKHLAGPETAWLKGQIAYFKHSLSYARHVISRLSRHKPKTERLVDAG